MLCVNLVVLLSSGLEGVVDQGKCDAGLRKVVDSDVDSYCENI